MTEQQLMQIKMQSIKLECESCREMLVRGLMQLKKVEYGRLTFAQTASEAKQDPQQIHNYNPVDAYKPTKLEAGYVNKPNRHNIMF